MGGEGAKKKFVYVKKKKNYAFPPGSQSERGPTSKFVVDVYTYDVRQHQGQYA